jgi:hypothetical protein
MASGDVIYERNNVPISSISTDNGMQIVSLSGGTLVVPTEGWTAIDVLLQLNRASGQGQLPLVFDNTKQYKITVTEV